MASITQEGGGSPFTTNNPPVGGQQGPVVSVVETPIPNTDELGKYEADDMQDPNSPFTTVWTDYVAVNRYEGDYGRWMLGLTSPLPFLGASVGFVQLKAPTLLWIADWTAARTGIQPQVPQPLQNDPNWVLLDQMLEPAMMTLESDGVTPRYRISGTYVYGHRNPPAFLNQAVLFARAPWIDPVVDRSMPTDKFVPNIISAAGSSTLVANQFPGPLGGGS